MDRPEEEALRRELKEKLDTLALKLPVAVLGIVFYVLAFRNLPFWQALGAILGIEAARVVLTGILFYVHGLRKGERDIRKFQKANLGSLVPWDMSVYVLGMLLV